MFPGRNKVITVLKMLRYDMVQKYMSTDISNGCVYGHTRVYGKALNVECLECSCLKVLIYNGFRRVAVQRVEINNIDKMIIEYYSRNDLHANILRVYGVEYTREYLFCAMEKCLFNLDDMIERRTEKIAGRYNLELFHKNLDVKLDVMRDILSGMEYLHMHNVTLGNLNPQSIFFVQDGSMICAKISTIDVIHQANDKGSISGWRAPEQLKGEACMEASDMFAVGCIFHLMIVGQHPFGVSNNQDRWDNICANKPNLTSFLYNDKAEAHHVISKLLSANMRDRPSAEEVLRHPMLWDREKSISFIRDVSDFVDSQGKYTIIWNDIASLRLKVFGPRSWTYGFHPPVFLHMTSRRKKLYDITSVIDLLRFIRNMINHHHDIPLRPKRRMVPYRDRATSFREISQTYN